MDEPAGQEQRGERIDQPEPVDPRNVDFHEIARRGDTEVMQMFLDAGIDPDLRDGRGYTLLMIAAYNRQPAMVELLLGAGADVDAPDASGNTPLMGLCYKGYVDVAKLLLDRGGDANARNNAQASPLMMAAMFRQAEIARAPRRATSAGRSGGGCFGGCLLRRRRTRGSACAQGAVRYAVRYRGDTTLHRPPRR